METEEIIHKYYQYVNDGDWDKWLTLFADDVEVDEQLAGHVEGIAILRGAISGLKRGYSHFKNHPKHIVIDGNEACVEPHILRATALGAAERGGVADYCSIKQAKIDYVANFQ